MAGSSKTLHRACTAVARQVRAYSAPAERSIPPNKQKYVPTSGNYPQGFLVGAAHAGVKKTNTKYDDIALVVSEKPCVAVAVTTMNIFRAAPVTLTRRILRDTNSCRSIIVNSGCANAVTGAQGLSDATAMACATDDLVFSGATDNNKQPRSLVMSTGVIGQKLPMDRILPAIPKAYEALGSSHDHWLRGANAICTTDTFPKLLSRQFTLPSHRETIYSIAGMTKGAGMIHPNMGTLLGIVCTDVKLNNDTDFLRRTLRRATNTSFNSISIDGDTSTNDTVAFFANGAAAPKGARALTDDQTTCTEEEMRDMWAFGRVLKHFMTDLAKLVVRDGEGATKFVTIRVRSDLGYVTAKRAAQSIATSALVKTALYGKDANWGRILCAIGYAPGIMPSFTLPARGDDNQVVPKRTSVSFIPADGSEELKLLTRGEPEHVDEERAKTILEMEDLEILVRLEDDGPNAEPAPQVAEVAFYTCDFSHEYVTINGDYRT